MKLWSILYKELLDGCRDQRSMLMALSFALLGPVMMVVGINAGAARTRDAALAPFALCGSGSAPELMAHLQASGLQVADSAAICLEIPSDYAQRLAEGRTAHVQVRGDLANGSPTAEKLEREISAFSRRLASQRLDVTWNRRACAPARSNRAAALNPAVPSFPAAPLPATAVSVRPQPSPRSRLPNRPASQAADAIA